MSDGAMNSARSRIAGLLDENSFIEFGAEITARSTNFNVQDNKEASDAVVTGYGLIDGNPVFVYAQSSDIMGGSMGEMHIAKISSLYDRAMLQGFPVIGLLDSEGIRLREGIDVMNAVAALYRKQTEASGVVPQIAAVFGSCGGSAAMLAGLSDIVYMQSKDASLFVNSPNTLCENHKDKLDTSGAEFQMSKAGNVDGIYGDGEILANIRRLVGFLPSNNEDKRIVASLDDANRLMSLNEAAAVKDFVRELADSGEFIEMKSEYAADMVTGLIRLNGHTVGVVANNDKEAAISSNGCYKAAGFVKFCDCFNIPVITLAKAEGFKRTVEEEMSILRAAAVLTSAYAMATVPKVTLIMGRLYGLAYNVLGSKGLGADLVYGFDSSSVGAMDAKQAAKIICKASSADELEKTAREYENMQQGAKAAAARGMIDTVIDASLSRRYLAAAVDMLLTKREFSPVKKHSTL